MEDDALFVTPPFLLSFFPLQSFFDPEVQSDLSRLAHPTDSHVFRVSRRGQAIDPPTYKFVTQKELDKMRRQAGQRAKQKLQVTNLSNEK